MENSSPLASFFAFSTCGIAGEGNSSALRGDSPSDNIDAEQSAADERRCSTSSMIHSMRKTLCSLAVMILAACVTGARAHAQDLPERTDTIRGADYSDQSVASAFGLPQPTEEQIALMRDRARCMQTDDAVLCNLTAEGRAWEECANIALVGQFVVWFDMLGGRATEKRVYVAVVCGNETVTVSSLRKFPAVEFTLARRQRDETRERTRSVIFIQSGQR